MVTYNLFLSSRSTYFIQSHSFQNRYPYIYVLFFFPFLFHFPMLSFFDSQSLVVFYQSVLEISYRKSAEPLALDVSYREFARRCRWCSDISLEPDFCGQVNICDGAFYSTMQNHPSFTPITRDYVISCRTPLLDFKNPQACLRTCITSDEVLESLLNIFTACMYASDSPMVNPGHH